jgi:hypothetical protein
MAKKKLTIDDLLNSLQDPSTEEQKRKGLKNDHDTWTMIGERDFEGIAVKAGIDEEEVNDFLKEWVEDNPYANI